MPLLICILSKMEIIMTVKSFIFMLCLLALLISCNKYTGINDSNLFEDKKENLSVLNEYFGVYQPSTSDSLKSMKIFIDVSATMKGYTTGNSSMVGLISSICSNFSNEDIKLYTFGSSIKEIEGDIAESIYYIKPDKNNEKHLKYDDQYTNFLKVIDFIEKDDFNSVYLILTDLILSTEYSEIDSQLFPAKLSDLVAKKGFLNIYMKKIDFLGNYYSEAKKQYLPKVLQIKRPIYGLFIGRSNSEYLINKKVKNIFDFSIRFSEKMTNNLKYSDNIDGYNFPPTFYMNKQFENIPLTEYNLNENADSLRITLKNFTYDIGNVIDYKIINITDSLVSVNSKYSGSINLNSQNVISGNQGKKITFLLPFGDSSIGEYLCRLTFRDSIDKYKWVYLNNTEDDSILENKEKTYKISSLIEAINEKMLVSGQLCNSEYYLKINKRK